VKKAGDNGKSGDGQPHGREGGNLKIDLPFEEALRAALNVPPEEPAFPPRTNNKRGTDTLT